MKKETIQVSLMRATADNIVLFHPHIPAPAVGAVVETLKSRWIGQGPQVEAFEERFRAKFCPTHSAIAVGSGTDALHLAYILAGVQAGDEVVAPVFTCTATNMPSLYLGARIRFADVQPKTLNIDPQHVSTLVNEKTKAIVCVHYGGLPCDMDELHAIAKKWEIPVIEDAADALGATYRGKPIGSLSEFTAFSFQAVKHITTGDGGMLILKNLPLTDRARRIRWFGIDRTAKQRGISDYDISEIGFKYQMTDIAASMGLAALGEFSETLKHRQNLFQTYKKELHGIPGIEFVGGDLTDRTHAAWVCTILAERREELQKKLFERKIESNQVHYRNDQYSVFGGRRKNLPNMDMLESKYLVLPLHTRMTVEDAQKVSSVIRNGW